MLEPSEVAVLLFRYLGARYHTLDHKRIRLAMLVFKSDALNRSRMICALGPDRSRMLSAGPVSSTGTFVIQRVEVALSRIVALCDRSGSQDC